MRYDYEKRRNKYFVKERRDEMREKEDTYYSKRTYYLWFLSLKLILEMEDLGLIKSIIGKNIIDKKFYKDWDLDDVLNFTFYKWWKTHKELFETPSSVEVGSLSGWTPKPHFRYLRVDLRNNYTNIMKGVREGLDDLKDAKIEMKNQYVVTGNPFYDNEILKYNILVRKLNDESDLDVFESEKGRLKVTEKPLDDKRQGRISDIGEIEKESKLWGSYRKFMGLSPHKRELFHEKRRKEDFYERDNYTTFIPKIPQNIIVREFHSNLRTEINRYVKDYQHILCGVSQGKYRKRIKF